MHVISETDCADVVYQKLSKLLLALSKLLLAKLGAFFVPFSIFDTRLPFQKKLLERRSVVAFRIS